VPQAGDRRPATSASRSETGGSRGSRLTPIAMESRRDPEGTTDRIADDHHGLTSPPGKRGRSARLTGEPSEEHGEALTEGRDLLRRHLRERH